MDGSKVKILETIHAKKRYYLVFDYMDIKHKCETLEEAKAFVAHYTNNFTA